MMKKFALIALTFLFIVPAAMAQGMTTISKFKDQPIRGLIVGGAIEVRLSQEEKCFARVEILEDIQDKLIFEYTEEGFVRLEFKDDMTKYLTGNKKRPVATVSVKELKFCSVTGACNVIAKGKFSTEEEFSMTSTGNSYLTWIDIECKTAVLDVSGNSKIEDVTVNAEKNVTLGVSGTASAALTVNATDLSMTISGTASKLTLKGKATNETKLIASGTSSVDMLGFDSPKQTANVSGLSKVKATVNGTAEVSVGKTASYRFTGSGNVTGSGAKRLD